MSQRVEESWKDFFSYMWIYAGAYVHFEFIYKSAWKIFIYLLIFKILSCTGSQDWGYQIH